MYQEINAVVQSFKIIADLVSAHRGLADYNELASAVSEVNAKLIQATTVALASLEKQSSLANRIRELEDKQAEIEYFEAEIKRYHLHKFSTGALAHALNTGMGSVETAHYLCESCVDKRQISKMQPVPCGLKCHACGLEIDTQEQTYCM